MEIRSSFIWSVKAMDVILLRHVIPFIGVITLHISLQHISFRKHFVWNHKSFESFHSGSNLTSISKGSVLEYDQLTRCLYHGNHHLFAEVVVIGDRGFIMRFSHIVFGRDTITTVRRSPINSAVDWNYCCYLGSNFRKIKIWVRGSSSQRW